MEHSDSIKFNFNKAQSMCLGFEDCINNEDQYFKQAMDLLIKLVIDIRKENIFSENESLLELDPQNLKFLLVPYYQAET